MINNSPYTRTMCGFSTFYSISEHKKQDITVELLNKVFPHQCLKCNKEWKSLLHRDAYCVYWIFGLLMGLSGGGAEAGRTMRMRSCYVYIVLKLNQILTCRFSLIHPVEFCLVARDPCQGRLKRGLCGSTAFRSLRYCNAMAGPSLI